MKFTPTELPEVILVEPKVFGDHRGFFLETYHVDRYKAGGIPLDFVQDNHSKSKRGTLRGLHAQLQQPQGKLVRALSGDIFDVAVDARPGSPRFGQWVGAMLTAENHHQLYVPPGFLHGFCVLSESAEVAYKCTALYAPEDEISVLWNDPAIGIQWPVDDPLLSARDEGASTLAEATPSFDVYRSLS